MVPLIYRGTFFVRDRTALFFLVLGIPVLVPGCGDEFVHVCAALREDLAETLLVVYHHLVVKTHILDKFLVAFGVRHEHVATFVQ